MLDADAEKLSRSLPSIKSKSTTLESVYSTKEEGGITSCFLRVDGLFTSR